MSGRQKSWDRCLYCDASIKGDDAHVAMLHDPYCPHGQSLTKASAALLMGLHIWDEYLRQIGRCVSQDYSRLNEFPMLCAKLGVELPRSESSSNASK